MGSGNLYRWQGKETTVEESFVVAMRDFRGRLDPHTAGTFTWTWRDDNTFSVHYLVTRDDLGPSVTLHFWGRDGEDVRIPVRLQTTPTQFGGKRWWFTCPLIVDGMACNRRSGKLYLPPEAPYFGCRTCHNLTYRSCQEAHHAERMIGRLGWNWAAMPGLQTTGGKDRQ